VIRVLQVVRLLATNWSVALTSQRVIGFASKDSSQITFGDCDALAAGQLRLRPLLRPAVVDRL
jgi:hypothetical protein